MSLINKKAVIIGGTSGIGLATAEELLKLGAQVTITGFNSEEIKNAVEKLNSPQLIAVQLDISNEKALKTFFAKMDPFDYLATPGSKVTNGPFLDLKIDTAREGFDSKYWGQYNAAKYAIPKMNENGAIVFVSGSLSVKPTAGSAVMSSINAAVEALGRALATEFASKIRVNTLSPGLTDTPRYEQMSKQDRENMINNWNNKMLLKGMASPKNIAQGIIYLMTNSFVTGTTLRVDGGYSL